MGSEIGQKTEWNHDGSVVWDLLDDPQHAGLQRLVRDLNTIYRDNPALQFGDLHSEGFDWIVGDDAENSILAMLRKDGSDDGKVLAISNFTPVPRSSYRVGVPAAGCWREILNSDAAVYGGSNHGNIEVWSEPMPSHGHQQSLLLTIPPLATIFLKLQQESTSLTIVSGVCGR